MHRYTIRINENDMIVDVEQVTPEHYQVRLGGGRLIDVDLVGDESLVTGGVTPAVAAVTAHPEAQAVRDSIPTRPTPRPAIAQASSSAVPVAGGSATAFTAPMPGVILSLDVSLGDTVARGDRLLVLEAMKMKNELRSDRAGVVSKVLVAVGDHVRHGQALVEFES